MVQVIYKQTDKIKKYKFNLCVSKVTKNETKHLWNLVTKNDVSDNLLSTNLRLKVTNVKWWNGNYYKMCDKIVKIGRLNVKIITMVLP